MLPKRSPHPEGGWGCLLCGLEMGGAAAIICDECCSLPDVKKRLRFYCVPSGDDYVSGRAPIEELAEQPAHEHDIAKHEAVGGQIDD